MLHNPLQHFKTNCTEHESTFSNIKQTKYTKFPILESMTKGATQIFVYSCITVLQASALYVTHPTMATLQVFERISCWPSHLS